MIDRMREMDARQDELKERLATVPPEIPDNRVTHSRAPQMDRQLHPGIGAVNLTKAGRS